MKSYVDTRVEFYGTPGPAATKYANGVTTKYNLIFQEQGKQYGSTSYSHLGSVNINNPQSHFTDLEIRIKLPSQASFVSGNYTYDSTTHEIVLNNTAINQWRHEANIYLSFSGMAIGEQIQWPDDALTITGKEGGTLEKTFTHDLPWDNAYIEAPELVIDESSHPIRSMVLGSDNQEIICTQLHNNGTMTGNNVGVQYSFPAGVKTHSIFVPSAGYVVTDGNLSLQYTTNNGDTRTVSLPNFSTYYDATALGLASGEYMSSATLLIDTFKPTEHIWQWENYTSY